MPAAYSEVDRVWVQLTIPSDTDLLVRHRTLHEQQRPEPGIDGLARTNLRFS